MTCLNEINPVRCLQHRRESFLRETPARPSRCANCKVGRKREEAAARRRKVDDEPILLRCKRCGEKTVKPGSGSGSGLCHPCGVAARSARKGHKPNVESIKAHAIAMSTALRNGAA